MIVTLNGNIATGKSTLINKLNIMYPSLIVTISEPLTKELLELLNKMYNPRNNTNSINASFDFQYKLILEKFRLLKQSYTSDIIDSQIKKIIIMERSFESDMKCFYTDNKHLYSDEQRMKYKALISDIFEYLHNFDIINFILISPDIDILLDRIKHRGRENEQDVITADYLNILEKRHKALNDYTYVTQTEFIQHIINLLDLPYDGIYKLITGPMYSGKSTMLASEMNKPNSICISYGQKNSFTTHTGIMVDAIASITLISDDIIKSIHDYQNICIDEGQFFPDISEFVEYVTSIGKNITVTALSNDFKRRPFNSTHHLADEVIYLSSECVICGKPAAFSKRLTNNDKLIMINAKYIPVCRKHYFM